MRTRLWTLAVLVAAVALVVTGCTGSPKQDPAALQGVTWTLSGSSLTQGDLTKLGITADFADGAMSGFSGVNTYNGPYKAGDDGSFEAGPFASTMIAGPQPAMDAEAAYLKAIDAADAFALADGKLTLTTPDGTELTFEQAKPFELSGSSWVVTGFNNGKEAVVGPAEGSELTLDFSADSKVSGNGGVNQFNGPYTAGEKDIKIGPLASTKMAGPEALMTQEQQYLAGLEAATQWEVARGVLTLRDASGAMQVIASQK